jgi:hypothetical protein
VLAERGGPPLTALASAANVHDAHLLVPLLDSLAPIRSRRGRRRSRPAKLHADKAYNNQHLRADLRQRRITARLARPGIESSTRLGRHRWVIERSLSWLMRYRRLVRPLRTPRRPLPGVHHHRLHPHLPPPTHQTHQMRHGLKSGSSATMP